MESKVRLSTLIDEGSMQCRPLGGWPVEFVGIVPRALVPSCPRALVPSCPFCGLPSASAIEHRFPKL